MAARGPATLLTPDLTSLILTCLDAGYTLAPLLIGRPAEAQGEGVEKAWASDKDSPNRSKGADHTEWLTPT